MTSPRPDADTSATGSGALPAPTVRGDDSSLRSDASAAVANTAPLTVETAAIRIGNAAFTLPRPNRHHNVMWWLHVLGITSGQMHDQGFMLSDGTYASRRQALYVAYQARQYLDPVHGRSELFSEDLWSGGRDLPSMGAIKSLTAASPAIAQPHRLEAPETRPDVEGLVDELNEILSGVTELHGIGFVLPATGRGSYQAIEATAERAASALSAYEGRLQEVMRERDERKRVASLLIAVPQPWRDLIVDLQTRAQAAEARASAAEKDGERLRRALREWKCKSCDGRGSSYYDRENHYCHPCNGSGLHRVALTALEQKPEGEG